MHTTATGPETSNWLREHEAALDALPPVERMVEDGVIRLTRQFRGTTLDQAVGYLERLGGTREGPATVAGEGWHAELSTRKEPVGPSYRLTELTVTWTGDPERVEPVVLAFRLKAFRAPG